MLSGFRSTGEESEATRIRWMTGTAVAVIALAGGMAGAAHVLQVDPSLPEAGFEERP